MEGGFRGGRGGGPGRGGPRGGGFGGARGGRGGGGRGGFGGGGGGMGSDSGMAAVTRAVGRMDLGIPREFVDMAVAKEVCKTRPDHVVSKQGTTGAPMQLTANYFKMLTNKGWDIFQYRIDFNPEIEDTRLKKALMRREKATIGGHLFDGTMLFTCKRIESQEITTKYETGPEKVESTVQIKFREVGVVSRTDQRMLQVYNLILRRAMDGLKLSLMGRNYYDSKASIKLAEHHLELWPGYITSIRQHENDVMLCAEISYKVLRTETVYDLFRNARGAGDMTNAVVGSIIITDYNNTTYRVDRVETGMTPMSTFQKKGEDISYMDYYKSRYNIVIRDPNQPLLVSKANARQKRGGSPEEFFLIPELCRLTGITDQQRANFHLMKAMSEHTRVDPRNRQLRLRDFNERLHKSEDSTKAFNEFGLELDKTLVSVKGRQIPREVVLFAGREVPLKDNADWTGDLRNVSLFSKQFALDNWIVLTTRRVRRETDDFLKLLSQAGRELGLQVAQPQV